MIVSVLGAVAWCTTGQLPMQLNIAVHAKPSRNTGFRCHISKSSPNLATEYCGNYDTDYMEYSIC